MAVYAIGDIQGCQTNLEALLDLIEFQPEQDQVWFTGDLVNRGPHSLETLRFVKSLGNNAITVLGNHDLHLLAVAEGVRPLKGTDGLLPILDAPDREELLYWLRHRPLIHADSSLRTLLVHAGIYIRWSRKQALLRAAEVETVLHGKDYLELLQNMYGRKPTRWRKELGSWNRSRFIVNAFTRMRYCDAEGNLEYTCKGSPGTQQAGLVPWFRHPDRRCKKWRIVFGHWSALGYLRENNVISLDSGCLWGGALTAVKLDPDPERIWQIDCSPERKANQLPISSTGRLRTG